MPEFNFIKRTFLKWGLNNFPDRVDKRLERIDPDLNAVLRCGSYLPADQWVLFQARTEQLGLKNNQVT